MVHSWKKLGAFYTAFVVLFWLILYAFGTVQAETLTTTALTNFETDHFSGSGQCAICHSNLTDSSGNDVSNDTLWRSTMMANSAKDPLWQAKVEAEIADNPAIAAEIEEKCATCHMPMAYTEAQNSGTTVSIFGDGFLNETNPLHEAAMDGVSCTVCHQISPTNLGTTASYSGNFVIDMDANRPNRPIYGPYENPQSGNIMSWSSGFTPTYSDHVNNSTLCATCHTLYTDAVDSTGNATGDEFAEQMVYREWQSSAFGNGDSDDQSCQSCHMPLADGGVKIANSPFNLPEREPFYQHYFVGGNAFMLRMLRDNGATLGVTATTEQFDATIARTQDLLNNQTANLAIGNVNLGSDTLSFDTAVDSLVGHKLPSGIPMRRAWLHVVVRDASNSIVFESGKPLSNGQIEGADGDTNLSAFEPHYDTISSSTQVQIYESVMQDSDDSVTQSLMRGASYVKDNRLLPNGFVKASAAWDVAVLGSAASDSDFVGGGDVVTYLVDVDNATGPFEISAELLYQSVSAPYAIDLAQSSGPLATQFSNWFTAADQTPETIASVVQNTSTVPAATTLLTVNSQSHVGSWSFVIAIILGVLTLLLVCLKWLRSH